jgi:hypothetical protein
LKCSEEKRERERKEDNMQELDHESAVVLLQEESWEIAS